MEVTSALLLSLLNFSSCKRLLFLRDLSFILGEFNKSIAGVRRDR